MGVSDAEDAVQECWLRLDRSDASNVNDLQGWLTTVVGRICLDMLRRRRNRAERHFGDWLPEPGHVCLTHCLETGSVHKTCVQAFAPAG